MDCIHLVASIAFLLLFFVVLFYRYKEAKRFTKKIQNDFKIIDKQVLLSYSDLNGRITYASDALCKLSGYTREELLGQAYSIFGHPDTKPEVFKNLWETIQSGKEWRGELQNMRSDSTPYWFNILISPNLNDSGEIESYTAICEEITDKKRIEKLIITDQLTQIYNRMFLDRTYTYEVHRSLRFGSRFSTILIDIDNFKSINDSYGQDVGDKVLIEMAKLLKDSIRKTDIIGRWDGEEFLIICHKSSMEQSVQLAKKLQKVIKESEFYEVGQLTCSFGVSEYKSHDKEKEVVQRAENALLRAKNKGKNCVKFEE